MHLGQTVTGVLTLLAVVAVPVSAGDAWYSMTTIKNDSPYIVTYDHGWGEERDYRHSVTLKPGQSWNHWWTYKSANQNHSPNFYIRVEGDEGSYRLRCFAVATTKEDGKIYNIKYDTATRKFKVYAKLYTN